MKKLLVIVLVSFQLGPLFAFPPISGKKAENLCKNKKAGEGCSCSRKTDKWGKRIFNGKCKVAVNTQSEYDGRIICSFCHKRTYDWNV